jgi:AAA+ superfamily predicted ATPase
VPIRPKYTLGHGRPIAQRQFTDREDLIEVFASARESTRHDAPHVLVFYGVGGVGKTCLRRKLLEVAEMETDTICAALA